MSDQDVSGSGEPQGSASNLTDAERATRLASLDEQLAKFESQKRWSDVIKTILAKAEIHDDIGEKVSLYSQAGALFLEKSSNQAEAIKAYESVRKYDPTNAEAIARLKEMYEKRRDWENLVRVMRVEAEMLDENDRAFRYIEMAQLATERLRKPEVCIDLWQLVLTQDPENPDALTQLSGLYERAREWAPLANVLEKQVDKTRDAATLGPLLQKLGMIYADKLGDDEGAVRTFQRVLELDPNDRRAQEQLKKRYITLKAWDDLEQFYSAGDKWDELIRTLERETENKDATTEDKIDLFFRVARLWATKKEKLDRAAKAYEKVLELDATNLEAAIALSPIYEQARDAKKLAAVYEVRLLHLEEPTERVMLLRETGVLYEERLKDPATAFERYIEAFLVDPQIDVVREDIERVATAVNGWDRLGVAYAEAIHQAPTEDAALALRVNFGRVLTELGKVDEAITQYRAVYDARPDLVDAATRLETLYRQTSRFGDLLEVYQRRIELEQDQTARRALAYHTAALLENELANPTDAIEAYRGILSEYGDGEMDAYASLDRLYESEGRWADLAVTLERRIDLGPASEEELASLKFRLARALENHLEEPARALELYREILSLMPEHDGARDALESMLGNATYGPAAAQVLEPIYEMRGDWAKLVRALEVYLKSIEDADQRAELLTKIGEVTQTRIGDGSRAFDAYARALREVPSSEQTLARLTQLAYDVERFPDLVPVIVDLAGKSRDAELSRRLYIQAAQMYEAQLRDIDGAVLSYMQVLDADPGDVEVLAALEDLYRRTARWSELLGILRRRAELAADVAQQEAILEQMAELHETQLNDQAAAISLHREILELDPTSTRALLALDRLFERQEMWTDLADNVSRRLSLAQLPEEQTQLMLRLADLREQRMAAVDGAIQIYQQVLERDPSNATALAALERLVAQPEFQIQITEILEPLYREQNEFQKLIGVHEMQLLHAPSAEQRVELLHRIAELYEVALDDTPSAFATHARALSEDAASGVTQEQLERISRQSNNFQPLAEVYEAQIKKLDDPSLAAMLLVKAAEIREEKLQDNAAAIRHYEYVLELDDTHLDAATALERLFHMSERYEDLAKIYLRKAKMLDATDAQKDYFFRGAAIYEDLLERPVEAIEVYKQVLEVDGEDLRALDKLIELYLRLAKWEELLSVYTRKADIVTDSDEKKSLLVEVGAVYERELGDRAKAIDTYQRILEIDPDDLTAIGRLDALYQAGGNWQELLSVLEHESELAADPSEVISYRYRIADLWHHHLDDAQRAVEGYREILDAQPDHEPTLHALEQMVSSNLEPVAAAGVLEPIYRASADWQKLIAVHEVQITHESDALRKVELLHQVAELNETALDRPQDAFKAFARALPFDSANPQTLSALERLAAQLNAWGELTRLYDSEVQKLREGDAQPLVELALRLAQIYEVQVGDVESAIARYSIVVEADDSHLQAIEALDRLYEGTERWQDLTGILRRESQLAASPDDVLRFQFRLGEVYQTRLGDADHAIAEYKEILAAAPEYEPAVTALEGLFAQGVQPLQIAEILEPLYRVQEAWDRLISVHYVQLSNLEDQNERVAMMHRIAEIAEERAQDHQTAFDWEQRVLLEAPHDEQANAEVDRLAPVLDGYNALANTYADILAQPNRRPATKVFVGKRLAVLYEKELQDNEKAEATYRYVLGVDDTDAEALEALDRIYTGANAYEALAETLRKRIAATEAGAEGTSKSDLVDLNYRLGRTYEIDLNRPAEAIKTFRHVLDDHDTQHAESITALAAIYTRAEDWANLSETYTRELDVVVGDSAQSDIYAKMARLASDHLNDKAKSVELWKKVLDLRGEDAEALNAIGDIFASQENWRDLVEILEREVNVASDDAMRVAIYSDLGRIWYEKLQRDRNALENWERVLDLDAGNTDALFAMAAIYRAGQQHNDLVDTLNRVIDVGAATLEDATLEAVYIELASLYENTLSQPMDAVEALRKALDLRPANHESLDSLERIHRKEAQWEDAIGVKERRANAFDDPDQKIAELLSVAAMWESEASDKDKGSSAYQRILALRPLHDEAFTKLEELHREASRWDDLIQLYLDRYEATDGTADRVALLRKVALVYENELDDRNQAFDSLTIAWSEDYTDQKTSAELERLAELTQRWNELLAAANEALQQVADPQLKIAICLSCAKWYGTKLKHPEYAIPYFQQILTLDPTNLAAMRQMAELYRATQQWPTLAQVLGRLVEMTDDAGEKMALYVQMGELAETNLGVPEQAMRYYQEALEFDSAHLGALEALERIFRDRGEWQSLLEVLRRKVSAHAEPLQQIPDRIKIAELFEHQLDDSDKAISTYREVLEADALNLPALRGLERQYMAKERWQDLSTVLEAQLEVVATEKEKISVLSRLATMWEEEFVKLDKAAERLEQIVDIDPMHEAALRSLSRIYRQLQRWDDLIGTLDRHVSATPDRKQKVDLFQAMGETYAQEKQDVDNAISAYQNLLAIEEKNVGALDAVSRLYEKRGDHSSAIDAMEQLIKMLNEPAAIVELRYRMGNLLDTQLGDRSAAVDQFQSALDVEPGHLPSLEAMRKIHIDNSDWLSASRVLEQETHHQQNARQLSRLYTDLGQIYDTRLDEHERAIAAYESAIKADADNEDAAMPLVDEYTKENRWSDAMPLLELLVKRANRRPTEEQHRLWATLGEASMHVGNDDQALKAYAHANTLDPQHLPTLQGLAASHYRLKDWEKAFKFYQMILVQHREALAKDEVTDTFYRLGVIKREQGERRKAINMFDKALEEDAHHRPTLEAVVTLYAESEEWEQVIHFKKQIVDSLSADDQYPLLVEIGDIWADKLDESEKAIASYVHASEVQPKSHALLHKLLALYEKTKNYEMMIETIQKVSDIDERAIAKSKFAYTIAVIKRDQFNDAAGAIEKFDEALDHDHTQLKAFEAINKLLTMQKDWRNLEREFRKMLRRIVNKGNNELEWNLWHNLGVIYRDRMQKYESAAEAFKMASNLKPDMLEEHQILAELYALVPSRIEDAIAEHQYLLKQDPYRVDSYRSLYKLYFDARQYDKAWYLTSTLTFLKKADAEQQGFYEQYRVRGMIRPQARLDNERWIRDLFHPDEDLYVGKIFETMTPALMAMKQLSDKQLGLNKKQQHDPATSTTAFAKTFGFVGQVLGLPMPRLFLRPDAQVGLVYGLADPPASVAGSVLLSGLSPQDLTFVIAKHLSYYRGEHYLRWILPTTDELKAALLAGMRIVGMGPADANIDASAKQISSRMLPIHVEALKAVCKRFVEAGARTDIKKWVQAVEITGCRAGFLMCNDLEIAARMIQSEPPTGVGDLQPKEKVKELVLFSVSEQYFRLREALGIQISI
ncbi:MAG: tetratricopeptide repeat protein [Sandaracinaceae bacterium]|nr:tetratricopeptide repeat protein [Sandaracinaceae bacterium]